LEALPPASHPMDVMRTAVSVLGCLLPEKDDHNIPDARDIADRLMACLGPALLYWYHYSHNGRMIDVETDDDSIGGNFLRLLHGEEAPEEWVKAMHVSLILYAEHAFNASSFTSRVMAGTGADMYSAVAGAIGALRGPKHGGANEVALEVQQRHDRAEQAEGEDRRRREEHELDIPSRHAHDPHLRLVLGGVVPDGGRSHGTVHAAVRDRTYGRLGSAHHRAAHRQQDHSPHGQLHRAGRSEVRTHRRTLILDAASAPEPGCGPDEPLCRLRGRRLS